jgi:uncharacterized protein (DUF2235 family)
MVYYQAGIGTSSKHFITPLFIALSKAADMAIAHGLRDHVTGASLFILVILPANDFNDVRWL